jgi:hypothetical protein
MKWVYKLLLLSVRLAYSASNSNLQTMQVIMKLLVARFLGCTVRESFESDSEPTKHEWQQAVHTLILTCLECTLQIATGSLIYGPHLPMRLS